MHARSPSNKHASTSSSPSSSEVDHDDSLSKSKSSSSSPELQSFSRAGKTASAVASAAAAAACDTYDLTLRCTAIFEYFSSSTGAFDRRVRHPNATATLRAAPPVRVAVTTENNGQTFFLPLNMGDRQNALRITEGRWTLVCSAPRVTLFISCAQPVRLVLWSSCALRGRGATLGELAFAKKAVASAEMAALHSTNAMGKFKTTNDSENEISSAATVSNLGLDLLAARGGKSSLASLAKKETPVFTLTAEQSRVLRAVARATPFIFFTGPAGTGKSAILAALGSAIGNTGALTATTGLAAAAIGGTTIHTWAGLSPTALTALENSPRVASDSGVGGATSGPTHTALANLVDSVRRRRDAVRRWINIRTLVIDEISMLSGDAFDGLDAIGRALRGTSNASLPFGGIQIVVCGDFFQLPPVSSGRPRFAFQSSAWVNSAARGEMVLLTRAFRQSGDMEFAALLDEARWGRISESAANVLRSRIGAKLNLPEGVEPTRLAPTRSAVEQENKDALEKLFGLAVVYPARDSAVVGYPPSMAAAALAALEAGASGAAVSITLKVGAQVVLTRALDVSAGLVNGSRGVVVDLPKNGYPIVSFAAGVQRTVGPVHHEVAGGAATRSAIPLALAWALSMHKSQGMTLDAVALSLAQVFEAGQAYVALSRARSLASVTLADAFFDPHTVRASPIVIRFYEKLGLAEKAREAKARSKEMEKCRKMETKSIKTTTVIPAPVPVHRVSFSTTDLAVVPVPVVLPPLLPPPLPRRVIPLATSPVRLIRATLQTHTTAAMPTVPAVIQARSPPKPPVVSLSAFYANKQQQPVCRRSREEAFASPKKPSSPSTRSPPIKTSRIIKGITPTKTLEMKGEA